MSEFLHLITIFMINFIFGYIVNSIVKEYFTSMLDSKLYQVAYIIFIFNFGSIMGNAIRNYMNGHDDMYFRLKQFSKNKEMSKKTN